MYAQNFQSISWQNRTTFFDGSLARNKPKNKKKTSQASSTKTTFHNYINFLWFHLLLIWSIVNNWQVWLNSDDLATLDLCQSTWTQALIITIQYIKSEFYLIFGVGVNCLKCVSSEKLLDTKMTTAQHLP